MRIDMKREAEINQRKGLTWRTVLSVIWFALCLVLAYLFTGWLVDSQILDSGLVHGTLSLPPELSIELVRVVAMVILVVGLQFFAVVFAAMLNPEARERTGRPTARAQSVDYYEKQYSRRA